MKKTSIQHRPSCADDYDPDSLPCDIAQKAILESIPEIQSYEKLALRSCLDRILAEQVISPLNVPSHTNSAMDGYAIKGAALTTSSTFNVIGTAFAGKPWSGNIDTNQCIRIMTGAVMPAGTDTVIMQEHAERKGEQITINNATHKPGQNVRQAGEDLKQGQIVLRKGKRLTPADLGLIASLGKAELKVTRRLRVAFFSTGDELRSLGEPLEEGQIYDSNRYTLYGMLTQLGVDLIDMGVIIDDQKQIENAFKLASSQADVVITSGGVSVGEADYITETLEKLGQINFWKVAMKPGRPLTFGQLDKAIFFGLPGNPVSVMVTFLQFVQPALKQMMGESKNQTLHLKAICQSKLRKKPGRTEFQRGILENNDQGELIVHKTGMQGSGILRSMSEANCFIILPVESSQIEPGEQVVVQPLSSLYTRN